MELLLPTLGETDPSAGVLPTLDEIEQGCGDAAMSLPATSTVCALDTGDTAWMLFATTFVMLQTPATGIAQAGLVRRKNALSVMAQAFIGVLVGSCLWFAVGFAVCAGVVALSAWAYGEIQVSQPAGG